MKRLMLAHAFAVVKRVVFVIGSHNRRSQLAIEKIGGRRAGSRRGAGGVENFVYAIERNSAP